MKIEKKVGDLEFTTPEYTRTLMPDHVSINVTQKRNVLLFNWICGANYSLVSRCIDYVSTEPSYKCISHWTSRIHSRMVRPVCASTSVHYDIVNFYRSMCRQNQVDWYSGHICIEIFNVTINNLNWFPSVGGVSGRLTKVTASKY